MRHVKIYRTVVYHIHKVIHICVSSSSSFGQLDFRVKTFQYPICDSSLLKECLYAEQMPLERCHQFSERFQCRDCSAISIHLRKSSHAP